MNHHTFELLEFYRLREEIAGFCCSHEGREKFLEILPSSDDGEVSDLKALTQEWFSISLSENPPDFRGWPEVGGLLPVLTVDGAVLSAEQVSDLGEFCKSTEALRSWAFSKTEETGVIPAIMQRFRALPDLSEACAEIFAVIEPGGEFRDLPRLASIRTKITEIRRDIEKKTSYFFTNPDTVVMLQSLLPALKNGRQVLAVKANFRGRIRGIVHEVSQSGQTIYVEPAEIVERNNDLISEEFRLSREMTEILRELTVSLKAFHGDLLRALEEMVFFDRLNGASAWGRENKCVFADTSPPENECVAMEQSRPSFNLVKARHPFLREKVVPIDINIPGDTYAVIITGPNTGGKTVTLKTAALFALANQCGWPVPASEGTCLPVFDYVGCDIGDDQSIEQSLSTFSSHMKNISGIFERAGGRSLILLDELGSGTDPQEGAAIAMAVLDGLIKKGSLLLVTTHHGAIKHYGYTHRGCINASVEFNVETLSPTYRILMGIPGESRALDIAEKNGIPGEIISSARSYLSGGDADVSALIQGLTEKYEQLRDFEDKKQREETALREMRREADLRSLRLKQQELLLREKEYHRLEDFFLENRRQLENLVREIREGNITKETTTAVKKWGEDFDKKLEGEYADLKREKDSLSLLEADGSGEIENRNNVPGNIEEGSEVIISPGGMRGIVVRRDKKDSWIVAAGTVRISVRETFLSPVKKLRKASVRENPTPQVSVETIPGDDSGTPVFELRLLGLRRTEAEKLLIRQLDLSVMKGLKEFSVIHGKGNGVLQDAVISVLKSYPAVADFHFALPEHGGTGKTIVRLV